jgi:hypothetical protein
MKYQNLLDTVLEEFVNPNLITNRTIFQQRIANKRKNFNTRLGNVVDPKTALAKLESAKTKIQSSIDSIKKTSNRALQNLKNI